MDDYGNWKLMQAIRQDPPLFHRLLLHPLHSQKHPDPTFVVRHDDVKPQAIKPNDFALAPQPRDED